MKTTPTVHEIEMFYDGDCPLCVRETNLLRKMDGRGRILFTNIADPAFSAEAHGKTLDELMAQMHARLPDDTWITGVEVFRRLYAAVGFGRVMWLTRLPGVSHLLDLGYRLFAANRLRLTGRCHNGLCKVVRTPDGQVENLPHAPG